MAWSNVTAIAASWSATTSDAATWSASTTSTIGWQQLSSVTESDGGVDFVLRVDDQYPLYVVDARPSYIINDVETP